MTARIKYSAGDLVAVPLHLRELYSVALVARCESSDSGTRMILLYGFPEVYPRPPQLESLQSLQPTDATLLEYCVDSAITVGRWTWLGPLRSFCMNTWPIPFDNRDDRLYAERHALPSYDSSDPVIMHNDILDNLVVSDGSYVTPEDHPYLYPDSMGLCSAPAVELAFRIGHEQRRRDCYFPITSDVLAAWARIRERLRAAGKYEELERHVAKEKAAEAARKAKAARKRKGRQKKA